MKPFVILSIAAVVSVTSCGVSDSHSNTHSLRTPTGFYQTLNEYKSFENGMVRRQACVSRWDESEIRCNRLTEEVPQSRMTAKLLALGVKSSDIETLFDLIRNSTIETIRISDLERTPELRLAAAYLDSAFLDAGKGLPPLSLDHKYVEYIETFKPSVSFQLSRQLKHNGEVDLYTFNFYLQDGNAFEDVSKIDFSRDACRLSSVTRQIRAGLWTFVSSQINSLRLEFRNESDTIYLNCGKLSRVRDREQGHFADGSATLEFMARGQAPLITSFLVTR